MQRTNMSFSKYKKEEKHQPSTVEQKFILSITFIILIVTSASMHTLPTPAAGVLDLLLTLPQSTENGIGHSILCQRIDWLLKLVHKERTERAFTIDAATSAIQRELRKLHSRMFQVETVCRHEDHLYNIWKWQRNIKRLWVVKVSCRVRNTISISDCGTLKILLGSFKKGIAYSQQLSVHAMKCTLQWNEVKERLRKQSQAKLNYHSYSEQILKICSRKYLNYNRDVENKIKQITSPWTSF